MNRLRNIAFCLFLGTFAISIAAQERSNNEILNAASQVLRGGFAQNRAANAGDARSLNIDWRNEHLAFVSRQNGGFALIATNKSAEAIVAYSENGTNFQQPALQAYIKAASAALAKLNGKSYAPYVPKGDFAKSIAPLLKTYWDQGTPYNNLCPLNAQGRPYPTGCVSTALSQIMRFHSYPTQGQGVKEYSFKADDRVGDVIRVDFGSTTYDWDNMLPIHDQNCTEAQNKAVATLMFHAGVAVDMTYTSTGSGAYPTAAREGLITYFSYNPNIEYAERQFYSTEEWMRMVYVELNASRPILYGGSDKGYGGHAFVIDGYDNKGNVHVNWGWGEDGGNGYFDIALLDPEGLEFSETQHLLLGVTPQTIGEFRSHFVSLSNFNAKRVSNKLLLVNKDYRMYNDTGESLSGEVGVILEPVIIKSGTYVANGEKRVLLTYSFTDAPDSFYFEDNVGGTITLPNDLSAGTYRLYVAVKSTRDNDWRPVRRTYGLTNSYLMTKTNKDFSLTEQTDDLWDSILLTGIESVTPTTDKGQTQVFDAAGRLIHSCPTARFNINDVKAKGVIIIKDGKGMRKVLK